MPAYQHAVVVVVVFVVVVAAAAAVVVGNVFPVLNPRATGVLFPRVSAAHVPRSADEGSPLIHRHTDTTQLAQKLYRHIFLKYEH